MTDTKPTLLLFDDEDWLWHAKPDVSQVDYIRYTPDEESRIYTGDKPRNARTGLLEIATLPASLLLAFIIMIPFTDFMLNAQDNFSLIVYVLFLVVAAFFNWLIRRFVFRVDTPEHNHYVITDQRVHWQFKDGRLFDKLPHGLDYHFIMYDNLTEVVLKRMGNTPLEVIEWHGEVPKHNPNYHQIAKIVFVGVEDAMALVRLVEQARGTLLPVTDLRHAGGKKKVQAEA